MLARKAASTAPSAALSGYYSVAGWVRRVNITPFKDALWGRGSTIQRRPSRMRPTAEPSPAAGHVSPCFKLLLADAIEHFDEVYVGGLADAMNLWQSDWVEINRIAFIQPDQGAFLQCQPVRDAQFAAELDQPRTNAILIIATSTHPIRRDFERANREISPEVRSGRWASKTGAQNLDWKLASGLTGSMQMSRAVPTASPSSRRRSKTCREWWSNSSNSSPTSPGRSW